MTGPNKAPAPKEAWTVSIQTALLFLSLVFTGIITAVILAISWTGSESTLTQCTQRSNSSINELVGTIQSSTNSLVNVKIQDFVNTHSSVIQAATANWNSTRNADATIHDPVVDFTSFDTAKSYCYNMVKQHSAISGFYYGDKTSKNFIGAERIVDPITGETYIHLQLRYDPATNPAVNTCDFCTTPAMTPIMTGTIINGEIYKVLIRFKEDGTLDTTKYTYGSSPYDPTTRSWWTLATAHPLDGVPVWSAPYISTSGTASGTTDVTLAKRYNGDLVGTISIDLSVEPLTSFLSSIPLTANGFIYLVDTQSNMVATTTNETVLSGNTLQPFNTPAQMKNTDIQRTYAYLQAVTNNDILSLFSSSSASRYYDIGDVLFQVSVITSGDSLTWICINGAKSSDYLGGVVRAQQILTSDLRTRNRNLIGISVAVFVVGMLFWYLFAYIGVSRPLGQLNAIMLKCIAFDFASAAQVRNEQVFSHLAELASTQRIFKAMLQMFEGELVANRGASMARMNAPPMAPNGRGGGLAMAAPADTKHAMMMMAPPPVIGKSAGMQAPPPMAVKSAMQAPPPPAAAVTAAPAPASVADAAPITSPPEADAEHGGPDGSQPQA